MTALVVLVCCLPLIVAASVSVARLRVPRRRPDYDRIAALEAELEPREQPSGKWLGSRITYDHHFICRGCSQTIMSAPCPKCGKEDPTRGYGATLCS